MTYPMKQRFRGFLPVIVDVETGGFEPKNNALLEIAFVTTELDEQGKLHPSESFGYAIAPESELVVEPEALEFTGIVLDENRQAHSEKDALQEGFQQVRKAVKAQGCNRAVLVGHNAWFDLHFMRAAVERQGIKRDPFHPFTSFDTATLAAIYLGHTVLAQACKRSNIEFCNSEAHSALYDAEKTAELFCHIVNNSGFTWDS